MYEGVYSGRKVAIKKLRSLQTSKNPEAQKQSFKAELTTMHLKHPNIVRTLAATGGFGEDGSAVILMEYAGRKNLHHVLNDPDEVVDSAKRLKYAHHIASALKFSHDNGILHLDVKPANVIISRADVCKLGDFGCCQRVEKDSGVVSPTERSHLTGTFAYRAPELLKGDPPTSKSDVYSYGITLWQMLSREIPYNNENRHVVIFGVVAYNLRPPLVKNCRDPFDECYQDLMTECWSADVTIRPTSQEIVEVLNLWKENFDS